MYYKTLNIYRLKPNKQKSNKIYNHTHIVLLEDKRYICTDNSIIK